MSKSILAIGICFLLICSTFIPITLGLNVKVSMIQQPCNIGNGKTLYVGGSGPKNYTKIQDAVDNASNGDTVFVYDDSSPYYENVIINTPLNLIGEDKNTTIIDGSFLDDVITINTSEIIIRNFTIINGGEFFGAGILINNNCNNNLISNNNILYNSDGIRLMDGSSFNHIFKNNISWNDADGFDNDFNCKENIIQDNNISNNGNFGISDISGYRDYILNNKVFRNGRVGIINDGRDCIISHNEVFLNGEDGIALSSGDASNSVISWNNIHSNLFHGIEVLGFFWGTANNVEISYNNIQYNLLGGINLLFTTLSEIHHNNVIHNTINARFINSFSCRWDSNYWGSQNKRIQLIIGAFMPFAFIGVWHIFIPILNIDWHPAKEPYDI